MTKFLQFPVYLAFGLSFFFSEVAEADIYAHQDNRGVFHFTNVPSHRGYRTVIRSVKKRNSSRPVAGQFATIIGKAANRYDLDANLIRAVIKVESNFKSDARSSKGAQGLMQLMPETAQLYRVRNVYDPWDNIEGGVRHLKYLLERFRGDLRLSLAAYNAGIRAVEKYGGIPPFLETQNYVVRVLHHYNRYSANGL